MRCANERLGRDAVPDWGVQLRADVPVVRAIHDNPMATCTQAPADGAERLKQLLLVEDDLALERVLRTYFRASGYEVASEARLRLHTVQPDLILLDLTLPAMDGLFLLTAL